MTTPPHAQPTPVTFDSWCDERGIRAYRSTLFLHIYAKHGKPVTETTPAEWQAVWEEVRDTLFGRVKE